MSETPKKLRIAFDQSQDPGWTGGIVYMQNLLGAIALLDPSERPFTLMIDRAGEAKCSGAVDARVQLPMQKSVGRITRLSRKISRRLKFPERLPPIADLIQNEKVHVVFTDRIYSQPLPAALMAWIPDFQYMHMPQTAGAEQVQFCTSLNENLVRQSASIIVNSNDVLKDLKIFFPSANAKAHVASFVAMVPDEIYRADPTHICQKYNLPERFFYLPNQFWKHKNHQIVIKALQILAQRSVDVAVVCTGNPFDHRHPTFFSSLLIDIASAGVHERFRILGLLPRQDVFHLERQCLAILQPSLFEGWSTSIEEAKSIGKRVIASDLAVNQEQIPDADFFSRDDPQSLADRLEAVSRQSTPGPDLPREARARAELADRTRQFARDFVSAAQAAVKSAPK